MDDRAGNPQSSSALVPSGLEVGVLTVHDVGIPWPASRCHVCPGSCTPTGERRCLWMGSLPAAKAKIRTGLVVNKQLFFFLR